jgi:hypothetical protein
LIGSENLKVVYSSAFPAENGWKMPSKKDFVKITHTYARVRLTVARMTSAALV